MDLLKPDTALTTERDLQLNKQKLSEQLKKQYQLGKDDMMIRSSSVVGQQRVVNTDMEDFDDAIMNDIN